MILAIVYEEVDELGFEFLTTELVAKLIDQGNIGYDPDGWLK